MVIKSVYIIFFIMKMMQQGSMSGMEELSIANILVPRERKRVKRGSKRSTMKLVTKKRFQYYRRKRIRLFRGIEGPQQHSIVHQDAS